MPVLNSRLTGRQETAFELNSIACAETVLVFLSIALLNMEWAMDQQNTKAVSQSLSQGCSWNTWMALPSFRS